MSDGEIFLRAATPADRPAMLALLRAAMGPASDVHRSSFFSWKHDANPFGRSPLWVAEASGEVVALRAFLRWRLCSGTRSVEVVRAVDTATRADFRGRGLFRRLTLKAAGELQRQGVALVFNTPNRLSRPGYLAMGWRKVGRVPVWFRPFRPWGMLAALGRSPEASDSLPEAHPAATPDPALAELLAHPRLPELLARPEEDRWHTPRDRAYLRWRYGALPRGLPGLTYRAVTALEGAKPAAMVYRQRRRGRWRELDLAEILCRPGDHRAAARLVRRLLGSEAARQAHYALACAAAGTPQARALRQSGFVPVPWAGPWLTWRPLAWPPGLPAPDRWRRWRIEWGDLELF